MNACRNAKAGKWIFFLWERGDLFHSSFSSSMFMVKIVVLILEFGSVLEMLLLVSAGGENTLHFLYLFQKTKIFSPQLIFCIGAHHLSSLPSACLVTFLTSASTAPSMQNNSIFHDLKPDEMELLYSAYGDETGIQCALR